MLVILNLHSGTKLSGWLYATEYYVSVLALNISKLLLNMFFTPSRPYTSSRKVLKIMTS